MSSNEYTKSCIRRLKQTHDRELKRRQKEREREARKAQKAAEAPAKPAAKAGAAAGVNEDELSPNVSLVKRHAERVIRRDDTRDALHAGTDVSGMHSLTAILHAMLVAPALAPAAY